MSEQNVKSVDFFYVNNFISCNILNSVHAHLYYVSFGSVLYLCVILARLVSGSTSTEGLVQVYYANSWGWVCADQWNKHDADVACRMMDFDGSLSAYFTLQEKKRKGVGAWLINMQCSGHESSLLLCSHDIAESSHNCKGQREAGVKCKPKGNIYTPYSMV